jgi:hypothetical protein
LPQQLRSKGDQLSTRWPTECGRSRVEHGSQPLRGIVGKALSSGKFGAGHRRELRASMRHPSATCGGQELREDPRLWNRARSLAAASISRSGSSPPRSSGSLMQVSVATRPVTGGSSMTDHEANAAPAPDDSARRPTWLPPRYISLTALAAAGRPLKWLHEHDATPCSRI